MTTDTSFTKMGKFETARDLPELGIGMLGYAFMGKAHSNAFKKISYMTWPPPCIPRLVSICGRDDRSVKAAAERYGYERATTDWHEVVNDDNVAVFDNGAPNDIHLEPCVEAAEAGKHVICEKPLGRTAGEATRSGKASRKPGSNT